MTTPASQPQLYHFHIGDEDRSFAHDILASTLQKGIENGVEIKITAGRQPFASFVRDAVVIGGAKTDVMFCRKYDSLDLFTRPRSFLESGFELQEQFLRPNQRGPKSSPQVVIDTVQRWTDAFAHPITGEMREKAADLRRQLASHLLAVVTLARIPFPWTNASLRWSRPGEWHIDVSNFRLARPPWLFFEGRVPTMNNHGATPELIDTIATLTTSIHVRSTPRNAHSLWIGTPPSIGIVNQGDAMAAMRAVADLPDGARLLCAFT